jgi:hypothetical protein
MKCILTLLAIMYGAGFLAPDTTTEYLNTRPGCIGPEPSGTLSCAAVTEIFCAADCVDGTDFCRAVDTTDDEALFEEEQMSFGTSTDISEYASCNPAVTPNDCRPSTLINYISCSRKQFCECITQGNSRICNMGDEEVFTLIKYAPKLTGPGCPVSP